MKLILYIFILASSFEGYSQISKIDNLYTFLGMINTESVYINKQKNLYEVDEIDTNFNPNRLIVFLKYAKLVLKDHGLEDDLLIEYYSSVKVFSKNLTYLLKEYFQYKKSYRKVSWSKIIRNKYRFTRKLNNKCLNNSEKENCYLKGAFLINGEYKNNIVSFSYGTCAFGYHNEDKSKLIFNLLSRELAFMEVNYLKSITDLCTTTKVFIDINHISDTKRNQFINRVENWKE